MESGNSAGICFGLNGAASDGGLGKSMRGGWRGEVMFSRIKVYLRVLSWMF